MVDQDAIPFSRTSTKEKRSTEALYRQHSQLAKTIFTGFLVSHVSYPEQLSGYGIEETITVQLRISKEGIVFSWTIDDDVHSPFYHTLEQALQQLPALTLGGESYKGEHQLFIPVHFIQLNVAITLSFPRAFSRGSSNFNQCWLHDWA